MKKLAQLDSLLKDHARVGSNVRMKLHAPPPYVTGETFFFTIVSANASIDLMGEEDGDRIGNAVNRCFFVSAARQWDQQYSPEKHEEEGLRLLKTARQSAKDIWHLFDNQEELSPLEVDVRELCHDLLYESHDLNTRCIPFLSSIEEMQLPNLVLVVCEDSTGSVHLFEAIRTSDEDVRGTLLRDGHARAIKMNKDILEQLRNTKQMNQIDVLPVLE